MFLRYSKYLNWIIVIGIFIKLCWNVGKYFWFKICTNKSSLTVMWKIYICSISRLLFYLQEMTKTFCSDSWENYVRSRLWLCGPKCTCLILVKSFKSKYFLPSTFFCRMSIVFSARQNRFKSHFFAQIHFAQKIQKSA